MLTYNVGNCQKMLSNPQIVCFTMISHWTSAEHHRLMTRMTEEDLGDLQAVIRDCGMACAALRIRQPLTLYSDNLADVSDIFTALLQAAERPEKSLAIPLTPSLKVCCFSEDVHLLL